MGKLLLILPPPWWQDKAWALARACFRHTLSAGEVEAQSSCGGGHLLQGTCSRNPRSFQVPALSCPRYHSAEAQISPISIPLSLHRVCLPRARRGLCPLGSFDLFISFFIDKYLFISFLFLEPEYPPRVTDICSTKGFYGKLETTHGRAESWFIFKPWALSDTLSIHPSAPSPGQKHLLMLSCAWPHAGAGVQRQLSQGLVPAEPRVAGQGEKGQGRNRLFQRHVINTLHSLIFYSPNISVSVCRHCSSHWRYSCEHHRQNKLPPHWSDSPLGRQMINQRESLSPLPGCGTC